MAVPESIREDSQESYPCQDCGGNITLFENQWTCDTCNFCRSAEG